MLARDVQVQTSVTTNVVIGSYRVRQDRLLAFSGHPFKCTLGLDVARLREQVTSLVLVVTIDLNTFNQKHV